MKDPEVVVRLVDVDKRRFFLLGTRETINWWIDNVLRPLASKEFYGNAVLKSVEVSIVRTISEKLILPVVNLLDPRTYLKAKGEAIKSLISGGYVATKGAEVAATAAAASAASSRRKE